MPESKKLTAARSGVVAPSGRLFRAAVSGLLALGAGACGDDESSAGEHHDELTDDELDSLCESRVEDALEDQDVEEVCADMVAQAREDAQNACEPDLEDACADMVSAARSELEDSVSDLEEQVGTLEDQVAAGEDQIEMLKEKGRPLLLTSEEKVISEVQEEYTFAELTEMCEDRGGYTQVHGACGGHNACAGFSYGDWGPGAAMLTEHSCSGVNGCLGLSCVVLPEDGGRTGQEIYEFDEWEDPFNGCGSCHGGTYDDEGAWVHDNSKFLLMVYPGDTRTADNWLDRPVAAQEHLVAFGTEGVLADGTAYQGMADYRHILSRAEIERVVEYIRTELDVTVHTIKTADP